MECPFKKPISSGLSKKGATGCLSASACLLLLLAIVVGCDSGPNLAPAAGTVTLDGKPVAEAGVFFTPVAGGPSATGSTDAAGHFTLRTVNREGALVGEHRVTITKKETRGLGAYGPTGPEGIKVIWHVPKKYSNSKTTDLTATVPGSAEGFTFELTSK